MSEYLDARGRRVDVVFGLLRPGAFALIALDLFTEGVTLPADDAGVVVCRLAGRPAALVDVDGARFLDVAALARAWPRLVAELFERAGDEAARALLASPTIVRPMADLKDVILANEVRAEALFDLGARDAAPRPREGDGAFAFDLPRGTLRITYTEEAFLAAQKKDADVLAGVEVRWAGHAVELPTSERTPWHDDEVAELAVLGSMRVTERPEDVVALYGQVLPPTGRGLAPSLALGSVLNLWGVALRKTGAVEEAVRTLEAAHAIATRDASALEPSGTPLDASSRDALEQQVAYNLGYARLQTTMNARTRLAPRGDQELVLADYDVREEHRAVWEGCLALFERALALDPSDATAAAQVRQAKLLLAALDAGDDAPAPPAPRPAPKPAAKPAPKPAAPSRDDDQAPVAVKAMIIVGVVIAVALVVAVLLRRPPPSSPKPPPKPSATAEAPPSPRELSERARQAALRGAGADLHVDAGATPCAITVAPPTPIPRGRVSAPKLARAVGTGELYGTEDLDATVRQYAALYAPALDVVPALPAGVGPVKGGAGPRSWMGSPYPYAVTLVVRAWTDPVATGYHETLAVTPGRVDGSLLVWSYADSRFVCAAEVSTTNSQPLAVVQGRRIGDEEDDGLNRARLDLVAEAYRKGIAGLRQVP